jgi:glycosyltransferase involved in cell wall biosynthesis
MSTAGHPLVSVCIPTYKRPAALERALRSVIAQDYDAVEIVVSDDSPDALSEPVVERARGLTAFPIRYGRNDPKLGQNANVNRLFHEAGGAYLILLHDDDLLSPGAITQLMQPVLADPHVRVVFGKQDVIDADGTPLPEVTSRRLRTFRLDRPSVAAENPLEAGLLQQFPNDSYLIESRLAREIGYRSNAEIGVCGDIDFGIRVGQALVPGEMVCIDAFVASYRISADAISTSTANHRRDKPVATAQLYRALTALDLPASSEYARQYLLLGYIDHMVKGFALQRERSTALRLFLSSTYGWRKRLSAKGAYHLALIVSPAIDVIRRY